MSIRDRTDEELATEKNRMLCIDSQRELLYFEEEHVQAIFAEQRRRRDILKKQRVSAFTRALSPA